MGLGWGVDNGQKGWAKPFGFGCSQHALNLCQIGGGAFRQPGQLCRCQTQGLFAAIGAPDQIGMGLLQLVKQGGCLAPGQLAALGVLWGGGSAPVITAKNCAP